jgi:hypothetical protein
MGLSIFPVIFHQKLRLPDCRSSQAGRPQVLDEALAFPCLGIGQTAPGCGGARAFVIACDKREAFAQGSEATKQSMTQQAEKWIASLRSQ